MGFRFQKKKKNRKRKCDSFTLSPVPEQIFKTILSLDRFFIVVCLCLIFLYFLTIMFLSVYLYQCFIFLFFIGNVLICLSVSVFRLCIICVSSLFLFLFYWKRFHLSICFFIAVFKCFTFLSFSIALYQ